MKSPERNILLNPGPVTTTQKVKLAQIVPDICPREEEFSDLMESVNQDLIKVINGSQMTHCNVMFSGSGTASVEAVLSSCINSKILLLINGAYGLRMKEILKVHDKSMDILEFRNDKPIDFEIVNNYLESSKNIDCVAMVHHETTTGVLNSIHNFSNIRKRFGHTLILDAISSYGGIPINIKETPIQFLISSSNKCIQSMPGLSFVICERKALKATSRFPKYSYYLNLYDQYQFFNKNRQMRFTPPVQVFYALREAIDEYFKEGGINRNRRYKENSDILKEGLKRLGFNFLLKPEHESHILLSVLEPKHPLFDFSKIHDLLLKKKITIYPGKIDNKRTFRIANIGDIYPKDIKIFLNELRNILDYLKIKLEV